MFFKEKISQQMLKSLVVTLNEKTSLTYAWPHMTGWLKYSARENFHGKEDRVTPFLTLCLGMLLYFAIHLYYRCHFKLIFSRLRNLIIYPCLLFSAESRPHYVAQDSLELKIILPQLPECCHCGHTSPALIWMSEWVPAKKPQDNPKKTIHVTELSKLSSVLYHQLKADVLNHDFFWMNFYR